MTKEIHEMIEKAKRSLLAAQRLYKDEDYDFATSRAYYAMFYMVEIVLLTKDLSFSKHSGTIAAFGQYFIKTGIFDKKYHKMLTSAFKARNIGDYGFYEKISKEEAQAVLNDAEIFVRELESYIKNMSG